MSIAENNLRNGSASRRSLSLQALSKRELRRRIWHMIPGLLVLPLNVVPHADPLSPTLRFIILAAALISAGLIYMRFRQIRRHEHDQGTAAVAGYAGAVLLTVLLLPDRLEVGLGVLVGILQEAVSQLRGRVLLRAARQQDQVQGRLLNRYVSVICYRIFYNLNTIVLTPLLLD